MVRGPADEVPPATMPTSLSRCDVSGAVAVWPGAPGAAGAVALLDGSMAPEAADGSGMLQPFCGIDELCPFGDKGTAQPFDGAGLGERGATSAPGPPAKARCRQQVIAAAARDADPATLTSLRIVASGNVPMVL